uniref:Uncharacterized protein n=1 Tax=Arundo donax TaxID=35708 RepID=A0A0A9GJZ7_ARUDO
MYTMSKYNRVKTCCSQRFHIQLDWGLTVRRCQWGWQSLHRMRSQILYV